MQYFVISKPFKVIFTNLFTKKQKLRNLVFNIQILFFQKINKIFVCQVANLLWCYSIHMVCLQLLPWSDHEEAPLISLFLGTNQAALSHQFLTKSHPTRPQQQLHFNVDTFCNIQSCSETCTHTQSLSSLMLATTSPSCAINVWWHRDVH